MLEVPGDFNYEVEPTPYGFSLSVTVEKLGDMEDDLENDYSMNPPWIDETLF